MEETANTEVKKPTRIGPKFISNRARRMAEGINNLQVMAADMGGNIKMRVEQDATGKDTLIVDSVNFSL